MTLAKKQTQTPVAQKEKVVPLTALIEFIKEKFGVDTHVQRGTSANGSKWVLLIPTEYTLGQCDIGLGDDKDPEIFSTEGVDLDTKGIMYALFYAGDMFDENHMHPEMFDENHIHLEGLENFFYPSPTKLELLTPEDLAYFESKSILA